MKLSNDLGRYVVQVNCTQSKYYWLCKATIPRIYSFKPFALIAFCFSFSESLVERDVHSLHFSESQRREFEFFSLSSDVAMFKSSFK